MEKQTSVEWLTKKLTPSISLQQKYIDELEIKAKEMFKKQIKEAFEQGDWIGKYVDAEQYYNETFKK